MMEISTQHKNISTKSALLSEKKNLKKRKTVFLKDKIS